MSPIEKPRIFHSAVSVVPDRFLPLAKLIGTTLDNAAIGGMVPYHKYKVVCGLRHGGAGTRTTLFGHLIAGSSHGRFVIPSIHAD